MDGTLVLGDRRNKGLCALPGALDLIAYLQTSEIPFVMFTNGTVRPPQDYVGELKQAGFSVTADQIMTPASVAAEHLSAKGYRRILVLGGAGVGGPLAEAGLEIVRPPERESIDAIFAGWFREFGMPDIEAACHAAWSGAPVFAASLVPYFASAEGRTLGTSCAIAGAIEKITGVRSRALGKPAPEAMRIACRRLGVRPADVAVIGDDPKLEIPMALKGGALAIGVTTGVSSAEDFNSVSKQGRAQLVLNSLVPLVAALRH